MALVCELVIDLGTKYFEWLDWLGWRIGLPVGCAHWTNGNKTNNLSKWFCLEFISKDPIYLLWANVEYTILYPIMYYTLSNNIFKQYKIYNI